MRNNSGAFKSHIDNFYFIFLNIATMGKKRKQYMKAVIKKLSKEHINKN